MPTTMNSIFGVVTRGASEGIKAKKPPCCAVIKWIGDKMQTQSNNRYIFKVKI